MISKSTIQERWMKLTRCVKVDLIGKGPHEISCVRSFRINKINEINVVTSLGSCRWHCDEKAVQLKGARLSCFFITYILVNDVDDQIIMSSKMWIVSSTQKIPMASRLVTFYSTHNKLCWIITDYWSALDWR